jgi:hypothetical protein
LYGRAYPEKKNNNTMGGYVYLLREREFIRLREKTYKIGRSEQSFGKRLVSYPKGSEIIMTLKVDNCREAEGEIMKIFKKKFKHRPEYGREYFEGDVENMKKQIFDLLVKNPQEKPEKPKQQKKGKKNHSKLKVKPVNATEKKDDHDDPSSEEKKNDHDDPSSKEKKDDHDDPSSKEKKDDHDDPSSKEKKDDHDDSLEEKKDGHHNDPSSKEKKDDHDDSLEEKKDGNHNDHDSSRNPLNIADVSQNKTKRTENQYSQGVPGKIDGKIKEPYHEKSRKSWKFRFFSRFCCGCGRFTEKE